MLCKNVRHHKFMHFLFQYFSEPNYIAWSIYWVFLLIFFALVKYINARLHRMFDTSEGITQIYHPENSPEEIRSSVDDSGKDDRKKNFVKFFLKTNKFKFKFDYFFLKVPKEVEELEQVVKMTEDLQLMFLCLEFDDDQRNFLAASMPRSLLLKWRI